jgi:hypothetical protein
MKQKGFAPILVVLIFSAIFVVAGAGYWYSGSNKKVAQEDPKQDAGIQNSGRSNKTSTVSYLYPNLSKPEVLVGKSHNIFVGKVIKVAGTIGDRNSEDPNDKLLYKQFEVKVLLNIKGDLSGSVLVDVSDSGRAVSSNSPSGGTTLSVGATYLLATRYYQKYNSHTLIEESHGWKMISDNNALSDSDLMDLAQKDSRVTELRIAYPNEIVSEGAVRAGTDLNSFKSLSQEKQDQLRAEAEQLKTEMQK